MPTVIPGLPDELTVIPDAPSGPDDPLRDEKRAAFLAWRLAVMRHRVKRQHEVRADPELQVIERALCARSPEYFAAMWLTVYEPRDRTDIGAGALPFVPFAKQVDVMNRLRWTLTQTDENADAAWSKCRGWGATWIGALLGVWGWSFSQEWERPAPWNVLYLSRKMEYVDSRMQKSIFWKVRAMLRDLPDFLLPDKWDYESCVMKGVVSNPANGNQLVGESTNEEAGRGDRATVAWVDEAAAVDAFRNIWSTLADTTDHRWGVSTEGTDHGEDWVNLRSGNDMEFSPALVESDWWENPLLDDDWLERQKKRFANDPDMFQQEILRNPFSGQTTWVYPKAWDLQVDDTVIPRIGRPSFITIDPGWSDETVLIAAQENDSGGVDVLDAYANARKPADFYMPLLQPSLFLLEGPGVPDWRQQTRVEWTTPQKVGIEPQTFVYEEEEIAFMRTVDAMGGRPTYVGDTYGDNITGATADSVYSRWQRYGIHVNRDRRGEKDLSAYTKIARSEKGRREALRDRIGRWRFAATPGAERTLKALRTYRFKPKSDRPLMSEPKKPLHEWNSHYATACEFFAVHLKQRGAIAAREYAKAPNGLKKMPRGVAWRSAQMKRELVAR